MKTSHFLLTRIATIVVHYSIVYNSAIFAKAWARVPLLLGCGVGGSSPVYSLILLAGGGFAAWVAGSVFLEYLYYRKTVYKNGCIPTIPLWASVRDRCASCCTVTRPCQADWAWTAFPPKRKSPPSLPNNIATPTLPHPDLMQSPGFNIPPLPLPQRDLDRFRVVRVAHCETPVKD